MVKLKKSTNFFCVFRPDRGGGDFYGAIGHGQHTKAVFLLIITALFWSVSGVLIKWVNWNPMAIAGMRSAIGIPFLLLISRGKYLDWSVNQVVGALFYSSTVILFVLATKLTTAANAILLQYTAPIYVAIFSARFLGERVKKRDWVVMFVAMGAMVLFFFDDLTMDNYVGNILSVLGGVSFALLIIFMRKQKDGFPLGSVFLGNILTALIGLPFMFDSMPDASSWVGLVLLGTVQLGFSYACYSVAIKYVKALEATMILILEPVLNPIWVFLFIGEAPGRWAVAGGAIIVVTITSHCLMNVARNDRIPAIKQKR